RVEPGSRSGLAAACCCCGVIAWPLWPVPLVLPPVLVPVPVLHAARATSAATAPAATFQARAVCRVIAVAVPAVPAVSVRAAVPVFTVRHPPTARYGQAGRLPELGCPALAVSRPAGRMALGLMC